MKITLFIFLIILHHTIQYENPEVKPIFNKKLPVKHEDDSFILRREDVKNLTNVTDYDTGDNQQHFAHYQNSYRELKDGENVRPWRGLRSGSNQKLKNWGTAMVEMRRRKKHRHQRRKKKPSKPQRPTQWKPTKTRTPYYSKTTKEPSKNGFGITIGVTGTIIFKNEKSDSTEEYPILLQYSPKHKKVNVPMIIFDPSKK